MLVYIRKEVKASSHSVCYRLAILFVEMIEEFRVHFGLDLCLIEMFWLR